MVSVTKPTSFPRLVTGSRRIRFSFRSCNASRTVAVASTVTGRGVIQSLTLVFIGPLAQGSRNPGLPGRRDLPQRLLEDGEAAIELLVGDDERHERADDVAELAARDEDEPLLVADLHQLLGLVRGRRLLLSVAD